MLLPAKIGSFSASSFSVAWPHSLVGDEDLGSCVVQPDLKNKKIVARVDLRSSLHILNKAAHRPSALSWLQHRPAWTSICLPDGSGALRALGFCETLV